MSGTGSLARMEAAARAALPDRCHAESPCRAAGAEQRARLRATASAATEKRVAGTRKLG